MREPAWRDGLTVVTGAAGGLGLEVARRAGGLGSPLVLLDRSAAVHDVAADLGGLAVQGDVSSEQTALALGEAVDAALAASGPRFLRVLLAAGIDPLDARSVVETSVELWDTVMAVNLRSAFLACRALLPRMTAAGGGSIVLTASCAAHQAAADEAAYTVSKTALLGLARSVSRDFGRAGVRATCLSPGPMEAVMGDRRAQMGSDALAARRAAVEDAVPLGREAGYAEVASAAVFLLGPESSYVSGTSLLVDGGLVS